MALERKQKIMIGIIIVAFAFVAWQLYDLLGFGGIDLVAPNMQQAAPAPTAIPSLTAAAQKPSATSASQTQDQLSQAEASKTSPFLQVQSTEPASANQANVQTQITASSSNGRQRTDGSIHEEIPLTSLEKQYLELANQLQLLKMQRQIIEQQEAIASAEKKLGELGGSSPSGEFQTGNHSARELNLVYLDYQQGRWTATVSMGGRFFEVEKGTSLMDNYQVAKISQSGVILNQNGQNSLLTFSGLMPLAQTAAPAQASPYSQEQPLGAVAPEVRKKKPSSGQKSAASEQAATTAQKTKQQASTKAPSAAPSASAKELTKAKNAPVNNSSSAPITIPDKDIKPGKPSISPQTSNGVSNSNQITVAKPLGQISIPKQQKEGAEGVMVEPAGERQAQVNTQAVPSLSIKTLQAQKNKPIPAQTLMLGDSSNNRQADNYQQLLNMLNNAVGNKTSSSAPTAHQTTTAVNSSSNSVSLTKKEAQTFAELEKMLNRQKAQTHNSRN